jgi:hypothetical protein
VATGFDILTTVHFLDQSALLPLCRSTRSDTWSWTLERQAVRCPACRWLLRLGAEALAAAPAP